MKKAPAMSDLLGMYKQQSHAEEFDSIKIGLVCLLIIEWELLSAWFIEGIVQTHFF